jgi:hypothetical protein
VEVAAGAALVRSRYRKKNRKRWPNVKLLANAWLNGPQLTLACSAEQ